MNLGPRKLTGFFEITGISQDKNMCRVRIHIWLKLSCQLYFISFKDENRTKKSLESTKAPAVMLFLRTLRFSHPHPDTSSDRQHWRADAPSPLACVSPISHCLIPIHFQETLCSLASRLKIISSSFYFVNFSSLEGSQLGEELCNLTVSWRNSPAKCIPIACIPRCISPFLLRESLPWESPQQERKTGRSFLKAHSGHCLSLLWCFCTQRAAVRRSTPRNAAISNSSNILAKWYERKIKPITDFSPVKPAWSLPGTFS